VGTAAAAPSASISPQEARAIEQTIRAQIEAFSRDDAVAAFSFATPQIQKIFRGDSGRFLQTVKDSYPAVYRPSSLYFLPPKRQGDGWIETVNIADSGGKLWVALYDMRRLPDKSWKINGCTLVQTDAITT
jgi:hypothetical protein